MSLQIPAGLANTLLCVRRAESSRSCGMSPHPSQGTEVTLHQAPCRDAGMELCTGTANVTGPPRNHWPPFLCYSSWEKKKSCCGVFNDPKSLMNQPIWVILMTQNQMSGVSSCTWKTSLCRIPAALPTVVLSITQPLARLSSPSLRWQKYLNQPRVSGSPLRQILIRHTWIALTI